MSKSWLFDHLIHCNTWDSCKLPKVYIKGLFVIIIPSKRWLHFVGSYNSWNYDKQSVPKKLFKLIKSINKL